MQCTLLFLLPTEDSKLNTQVCNVHHCFCSLQKMAYLVIDTQVYMYITFSAIYKRQHVPKYNYTWLCLNTALHAKTHLHTNHPPIHPHTYKSPHLTPGMIEEGAYDYLSFPLLSYPYDCYCKSNYILLYFYYYLAFCEVHS